MAHFPEDVLQIMQSCENALRETVSEGQLVHHKKLMTTISSIEKTLFGDGEASASGYDVKHLTYTKWLCRIVDLLDLSCEGTEMKTTSVELSPLLGASFKLNSKDAQTFHRVANLLFLKCFLFGSKVNAHGTKSEGGLIFMEKISTVFNKWNQDSCESVLEQWKECDVETNSEVAKETLYQWTHTILQGCTEVVTDKMTKWELSGNYVEAARLSDEYIDFLEGCNTCLDPDETEFLYTELYCFYDRTAELHVRLGKFEQAQKLCEELLHLFGKLEDGTVRIPIWTEGKVEYIQPNAVTTLSRWIQTLGTMIASLNGQDRDSKHLPVYIKICNEKVTKLKQLHPGDEIVEYSPESLRNPFLSQLTEMALLIQGERYSEAEKVFKRFKEEPDHESSLNLGYILNARKLSMQHWLKYHYLGLMSAELCPSYFEYSSSKWQELCRKFELILDMAEFVGDPLLKAELSKQYGHLLGGRSVFKIFQKPGSTDTYDSMPLQDYAHELERWIKEELGLPITSADSLQEAALLSLFSEPCSPDEHKKDLPPMLKSYRLLKYFMDTFSHLLHNWTKGSEASWLKLLESQKTAHEALQIFLLKISEYCLQFIEIVDNTSLRQSCSSHDRAIYRKLYDASIKSTLVWAERGRARSLSNQLRSAYVGLHDDKNLEIMRDELINFDLDEEKAFSSVMTCNFACDGAVFVEYIISCYNSAVFVTYRGPGIKDHAEVAFQFVQFECDEKRVAQLVGHFYKAVNPVEGKVNYDEDDVSGYLEELYNMLIEPIWPAVAQGLRSKLSTLVFVPDKILNRVPFALLRNRESQKYLFELHPISVAPSLRVLYHCKKRLSYLENCPLKPEKSVLALGGASYEEAQLLPGAEKELMELTERFKGRVYTLEKCDATSEKLLAALEESTMSNEKHAFGLMHLGVHCHWNDIYKTGAIQFAKPSRSDKSKHRSATDRTFRALEQEAVPSTSRDGEKLQSAFGEVGIVTRNYSFKSFTSISGKEMLQSEDIIASGLQWPTCLVVLSACNSCKGQVFGDGEVNLPRALMIAGVPATLVAQWKVVDKASPELMRDFYDSLQKGQDVATALQSCMLRALDKPNSASKIHEWGPFVVWGLPNVQLPKDLWTEDAKNALTVPLSSFERESIMSNALKLQNFLTTTNNGCTFENYSDMYDAISIALRLFGIFNFHLLVEQVFIEVPLEHLQKFEMLILLQANASEMIYRFRWCMSYAQAIQGNFQVALDYANALIQDRTSNFHLLHRQERAVILRLLGKHVEALKEFDDLLKPGFDYECQIERSCVKYLMGNKDEALEDARYAQHICPAREASHASLLSFNAIPPDFREWISKVCNTSNLHYSLLVPAPSTSGSSIVISDVEDGSKFGMNPNLDPELALALQISMEEERPSQEAALNQSVEDYTTNELQAGERYRAFQVASLEPSWLIASESAPSSSTPACRDLIMCSVSQDDDAALLEQALAMSIAESGGDDEDLAHALQIMSMQEQH
ncbi:hypothetical protein KC19_8G146300 [Ceratodon purpureus]|uniref:CHAT domain-containing protein n=1 Tax=Ceratodon purpureus TaxID=3225 RepID=A0A8T0H269_CERPU|nr:hypothetical protein KC19_8G146300 [Ceratodon purpureus]